MNIYIHMIVYFYEYTTTPSIHQQKNTFYSFVKNDLYEDNFNLKRMWCWIAEQVSTNVNVLMCINTLGFSIEWAPVWHVELVWDSRWVFASPLRIFNKKCASNIFRCVLINAFDFTQQYNVESDSVARNL